MNKVFISHSSEWLEISNFEEFLQTLGYEPIIVAKQPDLNLNPDEKAQYYMKKSDYIIFIISRDAIDQKGNSHPRSNVAVELGWSQSIFRDDQIIYILVEDAKLPSMINKTYIHLKKGSYFSAISQLLRNLNFKKNAKACSDEKIELTKSQFKIILLLANFPNTSSERSVVYNTLNANDNYSIVDFNLDINRLIELKFIIRGEIYTGMHRGSYYIQLTTFGLKHMEETRNNN
jgi:hypothetical protein